jgi:hypothetical protein
MTAIVTRDRLLTLGMLVLCAAAAFFLVRKTDIVESLLARWRCRKPRLVDPVATTQRSDFDLVSDDDDDDRLADDDEAPLAVPTDCYQEEEEPESAPPAPPPVAAAVAPKVHSRRAPRTKRLTPSSG